MRRAKYLSERLSHRRAETRALHNADALNFSDAASAKLPASTPSFARRLTALGPVIAALLLPPPAGRTHGNPRLCHQLVWRLDLFWRRDGLPRRRQSCRPGFYYRELLKLGYSNAHATRLLKDFPGSPGEPDGEYIKIMMTRGDKTHNVATRSPRRRSIQASRKSRARSPTASTSTAKLIRRFPSPTPIRVKRASRTSFTGPWVASAVFARRHRLTPPCLRQSGTCYATRCRRG